MKIDKYPIPKKCIYCGSKVKLVSNSKIYGREYGNGKCYLCEGCKAYVGVHPDLKTPLGRLANKELRELKIKAHSLFDPHWKDGNIKRHQAYKELAEKLEIPRNECHFGWFDKDMLLKAIKILERGW
ncbi:MAG: hypothetical protein FH761_16535 [Firmicutes bacterium]|nr:hypothetical protein [Bacillota bacterium]